MLQVTELIRAEQRLEPTNLAEKFTLNYSIFHQEGQRRESEEAVFQFSLLSLPVTEAEIPPLSFKGTVNL